MSSSSRPERMGSTGGGAGGGDVERDLPSRRRVRERSFGSRVGLLCLGDSNSMGDESFSASSRLTVGSSFTLFGGRGFLEELVEILDLSTPVNVAGSFRAMTD